MENIRTILLIGALQSAILAVMGQSSTVLTDAKAQEAAQRDLTERVAAINAHDANAVASNYASDAVVFSLSAGSGNPMETQIYQGRDEIREWFARLFARDEKIQFEVTLTRARLLGPTIVIIDFDWTISSSSARGHTTVIKAWRDDRWLVVEQRNFVTK